VQGIAGLFEVDPALRPGWLSDIPERFCVPDVDFASLVHELIEKAKDGPMRLVSLDTPIASSVKKYAKLSVTAHLTTPDYDLEPGTYLFEKMPFLFVNETFNLSGPPAEITIEEASSEGARGNEVAVCNSLFPIPFGSWQGDYISLGIAIPAPYITAKTQIDCKKTGIELLSPEGTLVSETKLWNADWIPPHPKGGTTRCARATMINASVLEQAKVRLGRKLAFFVQLRIWEREKEYSDYVESERNALVFV
jgi:hypothetical protein